MKRHPWSRGFLFCSVSSLMILSSCHTDMSEQDVAQYQQTALAMVGKQKITVADFENYFASLPMGAQRKSITLEGRGQALHDLICMRLDPLIDAQIREGELTVPDSAIRRAYLYYGYQNAPSIEAEFIDQLTQEEANAASNQLIHGATFEEVAQSIFMSQITPEGVLRVRHRRFVVLGDSPLGRILLVMHVGQISPPIAKDGRYVIMKVLGRKPATFEEARPSIRAILLKEKRSDWVSRHFDDFDIQIDEGLLSTLDLRASHPEELD